MICRLIFLCLIALVMAPSAYAVEINNTQAQTLKELFAGQLNQQKKKIELAGGTFELIGDITIEQATTYYAITLPEIAITQADGMNTKLGLTAINAVPTDNPKNWKMSVSLPSPVIYKNKDGAPIMDIRFDRQRMGGLWDGNLGGFSQLSAQYQNVQIKNAASNTDLFVETINFSGGLDIDEKDHLDFKNKIQLLGIESANSNKSALEKDILPKQITIDLNATNIPFNSLSLTVENLMGNNDNPTAQRIAALQALMGLPAILGEAKTTIKVNNIAFANDVYKFDLDADFKASANSILGFAGVLNAKFENLDKFMRRLEIHKETATPAQVIQINETIKRLQIIRLLSNKDGETDRYKIVLSEDGSISINDKDASALLTAGL